LNVIYLLNCSIPKCDSESQSLECSGDKLSAEVIIDFVLNSQFRGEHIRDRPLFLGGLGADTAHGGAFIPEIALRLQSRGVKVEGVMLGDYPLRPEHVYVAHRSLQSGNGMHAYSVNRAREDIVCNAAQDGVKFIMNDLVLSYAQNEYKAAVLGPYREEVRASLRAAISPDGNCVCADREGDNILQLVPDKKETLVYSYLPTAQNLEAERSFPFSCGGCGGRRDEEVEGYVGYIHKLLETNTSVFLYNFIHLESQAICSFYIGIFECDALYMNAPNRAQFPVARESMLRFNAAPLTELEDVFFNEDGSLAERYIVGRIQDGGSESESQQLGSLHSAPAFSWLQLDSRLDGRGPPLAPKPSRMLSKAAAFEILSHFTRSSGLEVEWAELFIHD
jgi:hypothetical protein